MKTPLRILFVIIPIGIIVCFFAQMIVANEMIIISNNLRMVEKRIAEVEQQNTYIRQQVVTLSSIKRVSDEAEKMGFIPASNVIAFSEDSFPVAIKR
jgi:cell division protein FtsL